MATATSLAITIQGVVLGLVFAFGKTTSITAKVGAVALATGVITGFLLYALAAVDVSGPRVQVIALFLFNLVLWSLFYGLMCIVAAFVTQTSSEGHHGHWHCPTTTSTTTSSTTSTTTTTTYMTGNG